MEKVLIVEELTSNNYTREKTQDGRFRAQTLKEIRKALSKHEVSFLTTSKIFDTRRRKIAKTYFVFNRSTLEVGGKFQITNTRVSQILTRMLERMERELAKRSY